MSSWTPKYFATCLVFVALIGLGQSKLLAEEAIDPSNPTQLNTSLNPGYDLRNLTDGEVHSGVLEGQMAGPGFLFLGEVGYGKNTNTDQSDWRDLRVRFFHLPFSAENPGSFITAAGWSIDAFAPIGKFDRGVGGGAWVVSPGVITAHQLAEGKWELYPNLIYNFTSASDDELKQLNEATGTPNDSQSLRFDLNISPKFGDGAYLMIVPSYTWGTKNADNSAYLRLFGGYFFTEKGALNLEVQFNADGDLKAPDQGEKSYLRLSWYQYL